MKYIWRGLMWCAVAVAVGAGLYYTGDGGCLAVFLVPGFVDCLHIVSEHW